MDGHGNGIFWRDVRKPFRLTKGQAEVMLACDAEHDLKTDATVMNLLLRRLIEPCERGHAPNTWSAYRRCDNPCFPMMNLMITGRCNFKLVREGDAGTVRVEELERHRPAE